MLSNKTTQKYFSENEFKENVSCVIKTSAQKFSFFCEMKFLELQLAILEMAEMLGFLEVDLLDVFLGSSNKITF